MLTDKQLEALEQALYNKAMEGDYKIGLQLLKVNQKPIEQPKEAGAVVLPPILDPEEEEEEW